MATLAAPRATGRYPERPEVLRIGFGQPVGPPRVNERVGTYCFDHDRVDEPWQRWVMRRGTIRVEEDESPSLHIGAVEDAPIGAA